jgi:hypothetical protein
MCGDEEQVGAKWMFWRHGMFAATSSCGCGNVVVDDDRIAGRRRRLIFLVFVDGLCATLQKRQLFVTVTFLMGVLTLRWRQRRHITLSSSAIFW